MQTRITPILIATCVLGLVAVYWKNASAQQQDFPSEPRLENWGEVNERARLENERRYSAWLADNAEYFRQLCTTTPGEEHALAFKDYNVAVSTDEEHAKAARKAGKRVVDCAKLPEPKPTEEAKENQ